MKTCPHCGNALQPDQKFCGKCGKAVEELAPANANIKPCPACGKDVGVTATKCPHCGTTLISPVRKWLDKVILVLKNKILWSIVVFWSCLQIYNALFNTDKSFWSPGIFGMVGYVISVFLVSWNLILLAKKKSLRFRSLRKTAQLLMILYFSFTFGSQATEIFLNASTRESRAQQAQAAFYKFYKAHIVQVGRYSYGTNHDKNDSYGRYFFIYRYTGGPKINLDGSDNIGYVDWVTGYRWESNVVIEFEAPIEQAYMTDYYSPIWQTSIFGDDAHHSNFLSYLAVCRDGHWSFIPKPGSELEEIIQDKVKLKSIISRIK